MLPVSLRLARARGVALLGLCFVLLVPAITPRLYASDEVQYYSYLRSLWFDHDVSFENEYRYFYERGVARSAGFHETFLERRTGTGLRINFGTIGSALLWSPFYAVADAGTRLAALAGSQVPADGYSTPYVTAVALGSACYGWLALVLAFRLASRFQAGALAATLAVWFGTPLVFYMYVAPPMSHACSAFAVALFLTVWLEVREHWSVRGTMALGAAAALMVMVREQDAFFVVGPAIDFAWSWLESPQARRRATLGSLSAGVAAGLVTFVPQALAYLSLNGYLGPSRLVTRKMTWWAPHALEVLLSPSHGWLWWTPLTVAALGGLAWMAWRAPSPRHGTLPGNLPRRVAICSLAMIAAQVYVAGSVESWTVAGAFGQRRFVAATPLLVLGLSACLTAASASTSGRRATALVVCVGVWWNLGLMAQFGTGAMDRQRLELARNAHYTFVRLPIELPTLVYRYAFDRRSFYRTPV
jgi:hypothetical protein